MSPASTRREFLTASAQLLGGGWASLHLPLLASLAGCSREAASRGEPFTTLAAAEAAVLRAVAGRILPSGDDLPGAEEAGAVWFMDLVLGKHLPALLPLVRSGVEDLERRAGGGGFASLPPERQDALLREVEQTPFFGVARTLTLAGVFADARYGGNRGDSGTRLLQLEPHSAGHAPPFGWYDAQYAADRAGMGGPVLPGQGAPPRAQNRQRATPASTGTAGGAR
jgi:hypothetical protein